MPKSCLVRSCPNKSGSSEHTLFRVPEELSRRAAWFEAVVSELPKGSTPEDLNKRYVCDVHFDPVMYHVTGNNRKRLFCNAVPHITESDATEETNNLIPTTQDATLLPIPQDTALLPIPQDPTLLPGPHDPTLLPAPQDQTLLPTPQDPIVLPTPQSTNRFPTYQDINFTPAPRTTNNLVPTPRNTPTLKISLYGINQRSKACQANNEREISSLKKKILSLERQIRKLKCDPPSSLIYKNRHKLAQYVSDEAWVLFDCAIQNQQRVTHGCRHSYEVKKLSASLANTCRNNRVVYKTLKSIFSLPSYRTLGRFETEVGMKLINSADALTIPTNAANIRQMRIECSNTSNMSTEDMNMESISDDSNYMQNPLVQNISSPIIFD